MSISDFNPERALKFADKLRDRAKQLQREITETEIEVTTRDKSIRVTVTIAGKVRDLALNRSAIEDRDPGEVAANLLAVLQKAQEIGEQAGKDLARRYLPSVPNVGALLSQSRSDGLDMR